MRIMKAVTERYEPTLNQVVDRLDGIARSLYAEGLEEQASSIETTIADLQWQCEVLESRQLEAVR